MKRKSRILIALCMMLLLLVACGPSLSDDEKLILNCAKQIPGIYGVEKDINITDDPWVIKTDSKTYEVIPFIGQAGSPVMGIAIFIDGTYSFDGTENIPTDTGSTEDLDKLITLRNINGAEIYGFEKTEVNKDTIMDAMK